MIRKAILAAALLLAGCGGGGKPGGAAGLAFRTIAPDVFAVVIDPGSDVAKTEAAIRKHCADKPSCTVVGWSDPGAVAHAYPLTDPQTAALVVRYAKDGLAGTEEMMWDCVRFRAARAPCIPKA